jgi:hypothetical protein
MAKRGKWSEDAVAVIAKALYPAAITNVRQEIDGPEGAREVDVEVRGNIDGRQQFALLECKDRKVPVDIQALDALHSKSLDLRADLSIIFSNSGFTRKALEKANRLDIGAMSALVHGDQRIRPIIERVVTAKRLSVDKWHLALLPTDNSNEQFPAEWSPNDLHYEGLPVVNWISQLSRDLLIKYENAKKIIWTGAFLKETGFSLAGCNIMVLGLRLDMNCSTKWMSQVVTENVTAGAFDHLWKRVLVPSGQSYFLGTFDRDRWQECGPPDQEAADVDPVSPQTVSTRSSFHVDLVLTNQIPPLAVSGVPGLGALLNATEQEVIVK